MKKSMILSIFGALLIIIGLTTLPIVNAQSDEDNVTLQTTVLSSITQAIDCDGVGGTTVNFGNLTIGTPISAPNNSGNGCAVSTTTNANNGYTTGIYDSTAAPNSSMTDGSSHYIPKCSDGDYTTPATFNTGVDYGICIVLFKCTTDAGHKQAKWGTGVTYNDLVNNKYAAVPQNHTVAHTVTGYHAAVDVCNWAWVIDAQASQVTGSYSGTQTFRATTVET